MSTLNLRNGQIDSIRAIAIFWVVFDHLYLVEGEGPIGRLAVRLFLTLSGFLITRILLSAKDRVAAGASRVGEYRSFYARRIVRIFPAYYATIIATYAFLDVVRDRSFLWHATFQSSILFAISDDWGPPWQLSHLWTLSVQEQFYLIWPVVLLTCPLRLVPWVIGMVILSEPAFHLYMASSGLEETVAASTLIAASTGPLGVGALVAWFERRGLGVKPLPRCAVVATAGMAMLLLLDPAGVLDLSSRVPLWTLEMAWLVPLSVLLVAAMAGIGGPFGAVLDWRPLQFLGRISLGIYLYHLLAAALYAEVARWSGSPVHGPGPELFAGGLVVVLAIAWTSWTLLEHPAQMIWRHPPTVKTVRTRIEQRLRSEQEVPPVLVRRLLQERLGANIRPGIRRLALTVPTLSSAMKSVSATKRILKKPVIDSPQTFACPDNTHAVGDCETDTGDH